MSRTKFFVLGAIAIALAILVLVLGFESRWQQQTESDQRFFPELEGRLNDVTRMQVQIAGFDPVTVARQDESWGVQERDGYPADVGLLRRELLTLSLLERVEGMTSNPEKYERLGLQPLDAEGSEAREIKLWAGEQSLAQLLAGKGGPGGGTYVRLEGDPQSWLSSAAVNSPSQPADWLDKELISIAPNRLYRINVQPVEGEAYTLGKSSLGAAGFTLDPVPEGKQVKGPELQRLNGAINALRLEDVVAENKGPESDAPWSKAQFETFDGLVIDVQSRAVESKHYLKLAARFDDDLAQQFQKAAEEAQSQDAATPVPPLEFAEAVKANAAQLTERFKGWLFVVPEFKAELFGLTHASLLEDKAPAATPQPTPTPEAGAVMPDPAVPQVQPPPESAPAAPAEPPAPPVAVETPELSTEQPEIGEGQPEATTEPPAAETESTPTAPVPEPAADTEAPAELPATPAATELSDAPEVAPAAVPEPASAAEPEPSAEPSTPVEPPEPLEASEVTPEAEPEQDVGTDLPVPAESAEPLDASEVTPTIEEQEPPMPQEMIDMGESAVEPTTETDTAPSSVEANEAQPLELQEQQEPAVQPPPVGNQ